MQNLAMQILLPTLNLSTCGCKNRVLCKILVHIESSMHSYFYITMMWFFGIINFVSNPFIENFGNRRRRHSFKNLLPLSRSRIESNTSYSSASQKSKWSLKLSIVRFPASQMQRYFMFTCTIITFASARSKPIQKWSHQTKNFSILNLVILFIKLSSCSTHILLFIKLYLAIAWCCWTQTPWWVYSRQ